ncbi:MAG: hypothetical protein ACLFTQ_03180 [Candidatus Aenigmatarchaeota archaeon]
MQFLFPEVRPWDLHPFDWFDSLGDWLDTVEQFRKRKRSKVREIVGQASQVGRGSSESVSKWIGKAEEAEDNETENEAPGQGQPPTP